MDWYYIDPAKPEGKRRIGPWSNRQMLVFADQGAFAPETLVWKSGFNDWIPWSTVETALKAEFQVETIKDILEEKVLPKQQSERKVNYAGFWVRLCAFAIDSIILQFIFVLLTPLHAHFGVISEITPQTTLAELMPTLFFAFSLIFFYDSFFVKNYSGTPGKIALGLAVVCSNGEAITWNRAFLRAFVGFFSSSLFGAGCLLAAFDIEKRALHDFMADTRVLKLQRA
ncbi:MAG: RDD family protein [Fibromonadaceae bacterium]|jgi:uncharacterized RDD family membrane protein YckC|nr:RDD family protein [Fibromonadaceae bacterium]